MLCFVSLVLFLLFIAIVISLIALTKATTSYDKMVDDLQQENFLKTYTKNKWYHALLLKFHFFHTSPYNLLFCINVKYTTFLKYSPQLWSPPSFLNLFAIIPPPLIGVAFPFFTIYNNLNKKGHTSWKKKAITHPANLPAWHT